MCLWRQVIGGLSLPPSKQVPAHRIPRLGQGPRLTYKQPPTHGASEWTPTVQVMSRLGSVHPVCPLFSTLLPLCFPLFVPCSRSG
ncbi:unnamed protein product [Lota lota]